MHLKISKALWYHFWCLRKAMFLSDIKWVWCHLGLFVGGTRYENPLHNQVWVGFQGPTEAKLIL
jgi:hypothetical protein